MNLPSAPEFRFDYWLDANGHRCAPIRLADYQGKLKVLFCYQSWCQGCHDTGFPTLKLLVDRLLGIEELVFFAVQTVFEGEDENTAEKIRKWQLQYNLPIPFGHDAGEEMSTIMSDYKTGGTPWFVFINDHNQIAFADFRLNAESAVPLFKRLISAL